MVARLVSFDSGVRDVDLAIVSCNLALRRRDFGFVLVFSPDFDFDPVVYSVGSLQPEQPASRTLVAVVA